MSMKKGIIREGVSLYPKLKLILRMPILMQKFLHSTSKPWQSKTTVGQWTMLRNRFAGAASRGAYWSGYAFSSVWNLFLYEFQGYTGVWTNPIWWRRLVGACCGTETYTKEGSFNIGNSSRKTTPECLLQFVAKKVGSVENDSTAGAQLSPFSKQGLFFCCSWRSAYCRLWRISGAN